MKTEQLYHTDAYLKTFEATVIVVEGNMVALDATTFYPGGGGQPHDLGTLTQNTQTWQVTKVKRKGSLIWHTIEGTPPKEGTTVTGNIDWERRYALMRTHTAMHILCGVVWRDYGAKVTGGNMQPLHGRMDFEFENLSRDLVNEIKAKINVEVGAARPTHVNFLPRQEADQHPDLIRTKINLLPPQIKIVRTIEIEGLDLQADGGTHVNNTQEVGQIRITNYKSKGRINKRLEVALEETAS